VHKKKKKEQDTANLKRSRDGLKPEKERKKKRKE